jgi:type II secretory pathway component PulF
MPIDIDPRPHDRAALAFEDLASALDAGLTPQSLGAPPGADGTTILQALLRDRSVRPTTSEVEILAAAWDAGRAVDGLRRRAAMRRHRADRLRLVLTALRYPLVLIGLSVPVAILVGTAFGKVWVPLMVALAAALLIGGLVWLAMGMTRGSRLLMRVPFVRQLMLDLAELPYLEVLHGLYASGVPLLKAHPRAVAACRLPDLRQRLLDADAVLQRNQPLATALAQAPALHDETRTLIANGERSGDLEDALRRALTRRSEVAARGTERLARVLGTMVFVFAIVVVVSFVFTFYSAYFALARGGR